MSEHNWPDPHDFPSWMRHMEKRMGLVERIGPPREVASVVGPGLSSYAVRVVDWNTPTTTFNGFYHSAVGALNSPDPQVAWVGMTIAIDEQNGFQHLYVAEPGANDPPLPTPPSGSTPEPTEVIPEPEPIEIGGVRLPRSYLRFYSTNSVGLPVFTSWEPSGVSSGGRLTDLADVTIYDNTPHHALLLWDSDAPGGGQWRPHAYTPGLEDLRIDMEDQFGPDGFVPSESPLPTVRGGIRSLFVDWPAILNDDPVTYEIHLGTTATFTADATTKVGETSGTSATVSLLPDGTPIQPEVTYWVRIVARDADGAATASDAAPGARRKADAADISAEYAYLGDVLAEQIRTGTLSADILIAATLATAESGGRLELDSTGLRTYDPNGDLGTIISALQSIFKGDAEFEEATVAGIAVRALLEMSRGSSLALEAGVTRSSLPPSADPSWHQVRITGLPAGEWTFGYLLWDSVASQWVVGGRRVHETQPSMRYASVVRLNSDGSYASHLDSGYLFDSSDALNVVGIEYDSGAYVMGVYATASNGLRLQPDPNEGGLRETDLDRTVNDHTRNFGVQPAPGVDGGFDIVERNQSQNNALTHRQFRLRPLSETPSLVANDDFATNDVTNWFVFNGNRRWVNDPTHGPCMEVDPNSFIYTAWISVATFDDLHWRLDFRRSGPLHVQIQVNNTGTGSASATLDEFDLNNTTDISVMRQQIKFAALSGWAYVRVRIDTEGHPAYIHRVLLRRESAERTVDGTHYGSGWATDPAAFVKATADFGVERAVIAINRTDGSNTWIRPFETSGALGGQANEEWYAATRVTRGLTWDGSNFWSLGENNIIYRYEGGSHYWLGGQTVDWWAGFTWYKSVDGYETPISGLRQFQMNKRAQITVGTPQPNDTGAPEDPDSVRVYLSDSVTEPDRTDLWLNASPAVGVTTAVITNAAFAAAANPPIVSTYPNASPAQWFTRKVLAEDSQPVAYARGDGVGRVGQMRWDVNGVCQFGAQGSPIETLAYGFAQVTTDVNGEADVVHNLNIPNGEYSLQITARDNVNLRHFTIVSQSPNSFRVRVRDAANIRVEQTNQGFNWEIKG